MKAYIGTVEVLIPVPKPVMTRPMTRCGTLYAVVWSIAPMITNPMASQMVQRRPSLSPTKKLTVNGMQRSAHSIVFAALFGVFSHTKAACEAAEIVARHNDSGFCIVWVVELVQPVFILQDAAEDALVIAKENKCNQATDCYAGLNWFTGSKTEEGHGFACGGRLN